MTMENVYLMKQGLDNKTSENAQCAVHFFIVLTQNFLKLDNLKSFKSTGILASVEIECEASIPHSNPKDLFRYEFLQSTSTSI